MSLNEKQTECKAIIFDLDGTLLDTLDDIADAANYALRRAGYPTHERPAYRSFVGDGSRVLLTRALPEAHRTEETIEGCLNAFISEYQRHWNRKTQPYDGIVELLEELTRRAIRLAVVTNKPHRFTDAMMDHYFGKFPFDPILGQIDGVPKKPNPRQAAAAAEKMGVQPDHCIFIGDSDVDMETAHRAGMTPVGASWGFRTAEELHEAGASHVIRHPLDLLEIVQPTPFQQR